MCPRLAAPALALGLACAIPPAFRPGDPSQAIARQPDAGAAEVAGVRLVVRPAPSELSGAVEERFTPVEVGVENHGESALEIRPRDFALLGPAGARYEALSPNAVRRELGPLGDPGAIAGTAPGAYPPWMTVRGAPWRGFYGAPAPIYTRPDGPRRTLDGLTLRRGRRASLLLLFPVPQASLPTLELEANLADPAGRQVGAVRLPFVRVKT